MNRKIRVISASHGFVIPVMEEADWLFKEINVTHLGLGNFAANGFCFITLGEYVPSFVLNPELRLKFTAEELSGRYHACFRPLEEFREVFPEIQFEIVNQ